MNERKQRIGENEAIFRSVNEEVSKLNVTFTAATNTMWIVCECGVQSCTVHIEITPDAYRRVREDPTLFVVRPGHDLPEAETVVEKTAATGWCRRTRAYRPLSRARASRLSARCARV